MLKFLLAYCSRFPAADENVSGLYGSPNFSYFGTLWPTRLIYLLASSRVS